MAQCPITGECKLYTGALGIQDDQIQATKKKYCHEGFEECARYRVWEASETAVPDDLLPNMSTRADSMISQGETIRFTVDRNRREVKRQ